MKKRTFQLLFVFLLLFCSNAWAEKGKTKKKENYELFMNIKLLWEKKDCKGLRPFLNKRIRIRLGKFRGSYLRPQALGILKSYFKQVEIIEFRYLKKKMKISKAVAFYKYKVVKTGITKQKRIYFYLRKIKKPNTKKEFGFL